MIVSPAPLVYLLRLMPSLPSCRSTILSHQPGKINRPSGPRLGFRLPTLFTFRSRARLPVSLRQGIGSLSVSPSSCFPPWRPRARAPRLPLQEKSDAPRCGGALDYRALGTQRGGNRNSIYVAVINFRIWLFSFSLDSRVHLLSAHPACFFRSPNWSPIENSVKS